MNSSPTDRVLIQVELRKGRPEDFKIKEGEDPPQYLYGRMYFVEIQPGRFRPEIFSKSPSGKNYFTTMYRHGLVYVKENSGLIEALEK